MPDITLPREHLAELIQCLTDANALLDDLCRAQRLAPDVYAADRKRIVENLRLRHFPEIPTNRPLWPQRHAST